MKMKKIAGLILAGCMVLAGSAPAFAAGTCTSAHSVLLGIGHCNANQVNVRSGPGTSYKSHGYAYKNDVYYWYETMGEATGKENVDNIWRHVHGDHIGWMHKDYFTFDEPARAMPEILELA